MLDRIARLDSRALVRVSGPDARTFLHTLLTQDVESLADGELRFGALLSPPGRLLFDLFLTGEADGVLIDVAADRREALIQRLSLYRLRAAVQIAAIDDGVFASWPGVAGDFAADPRSVLLGGRGHGAHATDASEADWRLHQLAVGVPASDDLGADAVYPIEADFDLLNGIDFAKGCFIGQETTSRMKRRGAIRSRMLPLRLDGPTPAPGTEVLAGELRAGVTATGADGRVMALLRLDRIGDDLTVEGRPARVERPAWARPQDLPDL